MWKPPDPLLTPSDPPEDSLEKYLLSLLTRGTWTEKQIKEKLKIRGADEDRAEDLVRMYRNAGYLDDRSYALLFAETHPDWGCRRLRDELRRRGVRESFLSAALEEVDEEERAAALAEEWREGGMEGRKIEGRLLRRGFPPSLCRKIARGTCDEDP